jgi:hypothetical protein
MAEQSLSLKTLRLDALPEFDPPPQLWTRIEAAHLQRQQRRRLARWGGAIAAGLAVVVLAAQLRSPAPDQALARLQQQSHTLEQQYAGLTQPLSVLESDLELRAVEAALQQAYDRGAKAEEIAPLWQQRNAVLTSLIALSADGAQLTRI